MADEVKTASDAAIPDSGNVSKGSVRGVFDIVNSKFNTLETDVETLQGIVAEGVVTKPAVRAATTANGTLATAFDNGSEIDGVTLATNDRILIKNQSSAAENGIYIVAASGAPTRATDADSEAELVSGAVLVLEGTSNAGSRWVLVTPAPITVGSTALTFEQIGVADPIVGEVQDARGGESTLGDRLDGIDAAIFPSRNGLVVTTFDDTSSGEVYGTLTQAYPGKLVYVSAGAARANITTAIAATAGDRFEIEYLFKYTSGSLPRIQLANSSGGSSTIGDFYYPVEGGVHRMTLLCATTANIYIGLRSLSASSGELTILSIRKRAAAALVSPTNATSQTQAALALALRGTAPIGDVVSGAGWLASQFDDIEFQQADGALTGYTTNSGASASGQTVTLAGAGAYVSLDLTGGILHGGRSEFLVWDSIVTIASGNALNLVVRAGSTVLANYEFAGNEITETETSDNDVPGDNLDMTDEFRIRLFIDRLGKKSFVSLLYLNDPGATNIEKQQHYYTDDVTLSDTPDNLRMLTDASGTGNVTLRETVLHRPSYCTQGSSIMAGSGPSYEYSPVPGFKATDFAPAAFTYWFDRYLGQKRRGLNCAVASGGTVRCVDDIDNVLRFKPQVLITDMGATNDINDFVTTLNDLDIFTLLTRTRTIVDKCLAARCMLVVMECLPRDVFNEDDRTNAEVFNQHIRTMEEAGWLSVIRVYDEFKDPTDPYDIRPELSGDGTHPNPRGQQRIAYKAAIALGSHVFIAPADDPHVYGT